MPASNWSSSFPAAPTNGTPCLSSWKPGASPTNIRSAVGEPEPKTTCVLVAASAQRVHEETTSPYAASADGATSVAAATRAPATAASAERGLRRGAVSCERRELLSHLRGAAVGAGRIRLRHPDELLEVRLTAHADVFVDRHRRRPYQSASWPTRRTDTPTA